MSLFVIRAFVKMREELAANATILKRLAEIDKSILCTTPPCATSTGSFCHSSRRFPQYNDPGSVSNPNPEHDRMPVIVRKEDWEQWLEPGDLEEALFTRLTAPYAAKEMQSVEVSPVVNSAREDSGKYIESESRIVA